jgi:hypothetical protein
MSDRVEAAGPTPSKQDPEAFVLRGKPRSVVRFRRGLIVGMSAAVATALVSVSWLALQPPSFRKAASAAGSDQSAGRAGSDALAKICLLYTTDAADE